MTTNSSSRGSCGATAVRHHRSILPRVIIIFVTILCCFVWEGRNESSSSSTPGIVAAMESEVEEEDSISSQQQQQQQQHNTPRRRLATTMESVVVYTVAADYINRGKTTAIGVSPDSNADTTTMTTTTAAETTTISARERKLLNDIQQTLDTDTLSLESQHVWNAEQQRVVIEQYCQASQRFDDLIREQQYTLATELYKWCALSHNGGIFVETTSPWMIRLPSLPRMSHVVIADERHFVNASNSVFVYLTPQHRSIAELMVRLLTETPIPTLHLSPLLLPQALFRAVADLTGVEELKPGILHPKTSSSSSSSSSTNGGPVRLLQQSCPTLVSSLKRIPTTTWTDTVELHYCSGGGLCCVVHDEGQTLFLTPYPIQPDQLIQMRHLSLPYNTGVGHYANDELPFISTIRETPTPDTSGPKTSGIINFYDSLPPDCIPEACAKCLLSKTGANCTTCSGACPCYCARLCQPEHAVPPLPITKTWTVSPPKYARDASRLIPRIIHQTWFESLEKEKYPNMSRLQESFQKAGWEYKFYTDADAGNFLSTHFPAAVREAYDTLLPGAFKADLFRYCVLLVHGGVYADVDIHLESDLDFSIPRDVGFLVPVDEPGKPSKHQMCLWNGLIAAAPGHPILAKAIETVVNQVRNRFTSIDVDATFCPDPELSVSHAYDTLFTAGPCLLGASVNRVLGRHGQTPFQPGVLDPPTHAERDPEIVQGRNMLPGDHAPRLGIPGRIILLRQRKWDMGAHRFTLDESNLVVAATDFPYANDRENLPMEHYSKTHAKVGVYGLENLYATNKKAGENVQIIVQQDYRTPVA